MVNIFTKYNGFGKGIGSSEELHYPPGNQLCSLIQDEDAIHIFLIVCAAFNCLPQIIGHAGWRLPAVYVFVNINAEHLIGSKKAIGDSLFEALGVNRFAKVVYVGNIFCFLGRGRHADLNSTGKIIKDFTPG